MTAILVGVFLAVLNSLWQVALAAALVWAALKLLAKVGVAVNAATRYVIWWVVLAVVLALPAAPRLRLLWPAHAQPSSAAADPLGAPRVVTPLAIEVPAAVMLPAPKFAHWPWWIFGLGAAVFVYRLDQIARSYFYLRGMKQRAAISVQPMPPTTRPVRLLLSREVTSPMAVGFLHPAVVLPDSLIGELSAPELEHVLMHEVAHIARRDDWTNLAARLLGGALALHPVAWWILRQIEREREIACDDWVVARTGSLPGNARAYAESLARLSELRWARKEAAAGNALASGIFGGGSRVGERIELLLRRGREFSPRASMARVAMSALAMLGFVVAGSLTPRWIAFAQEEPRLAFEAASIKLSDPGHVGAQMYSPGPGRFRVMTATLKDLAGFAYRVEPHQIAGVPLDSAHYDIEAKAESPASNDQFRRMLQTLLSQRFHVRFHREIKELPIYELTAGKNGPKLAQVGAPGVGVDFGTLGFVRGRGADVKTLAIVLSRQLGRSVLDKTEIKGFYDFTLKWTPDDNLTAEAADPDVFTAIQEQLGLKLEPSRGPVEVLVIDHLEKPDAN